MITDERLKEESVNAFLRNIVNHILKRPGYAIRAKQRGAIRPAGSYCVVDFVNESSLGLEYSHYGDAENDQVYYYRGQHQLMFSFGFYRDSAIDNARMVRAGLIRATVNDLFCGVNFGLMRRSEIRNISESLESGWEERAQFDVFINVVEADFDFVNCITSVDLPGRLN